MMALDAALLESFAGQDSCPTLRLYAWPRPSLSVGRTQKVAHEDLASWQSLGLELCRRPSGGRAVLHEGVFTYAWAEPLGAEESVASAHRRLAEAVGASLQRLGLDLQLGRGGARGPQAPAACFASATPADLLWQGRKLVGAAQARKPGALLQQGSLYLQRPEALARQAFGRSGEGLPADLAEALGRVPAFHEVAEAFALGFEEALGLNFTPSGWRKEEVDQAVASLTRWVLP